MLRRALLIAMVLALSSHSAAAWTPVPLDKRFDCALSPVSAEAVATYVNRAARRAAESQPTEARRRGFDWFAILETDPLGGVRRLGSSLQGKQGGTIDFKTPTAAVDLPQMKFAVATADCEFKRLKFLFECKNTQAHRCVGVRVTPFAKH